MGAESFTVLAIMEARDRASEIFARVDESLDRFSKTADRAAETARGAGAAIDEALGREVSVSDRLGIATARVQAAQAKAAESARALTDAERELLDAQREVTGSADDDAAASRRLIEANARLTDAQKDAAASAKAVRDAEAGQAETMRAAAAAGDENAAAQLKVKDSSEKSGFSLGKVGKVAAVMALGLGVAAGIMVKSAGNFQDSTTHLVTDAGVAKGNLAMVQAGILNVSTATGQSAGDITNAMYHIASSGFTAQNGLNVLKIAAEGARVGGADLDTTTKTLVGTMTAYYGSNLSAAQATKDSTSLMNQMIETVSRGDMRMQDLASSLSAVTPVAAAAHISFAQVGAAIATMTAQGMSARQATQDLAHTIRSLASPTNVQAVEMKALGLNANEVAKNLGTAGLSGTLDEMRDAVLRNTSGGNVMLNLLKGMTPATQSLANQILAGTITTNGLTKAVQGLNPEQAALISRFRTSAASVTGLQQTFTGAMYKMLGGATGLNVALMLTGKHAGDMAKSVSAISAEGKKASGTVDNWSTIQGTFNFKLAQAKTGLENTGIAIGTALLPAATTLMNLVVSIVGPVAEWTSHNKTLTAVLIGGVAAIAATIAVIAGLRKAYNAITGAVNDVRKVLKAVGLVSQQSAADQQAAAAETAAVQEEQAAEAATATEASAGEAAAAQEAAAEETSASWIASAAQTAVSWAAAGARMAVQAAVWVAQNAVKAAMVVAENVASAATSAAAWIAANAVMTAGIALVVAAVVAAVVLIVMHWKQISAAVTRVWHDVYSFISKIISDVIGFIKGHWPLLLAILAGPLALAVYVIAKYWRDIEHWFEIGYHAVDSVLVRFGLSIRKWFSYAVHTAESILSWFEGLPGMFWRWLSGAATSVWNAGIRVLNWFQTLPGKVLSWLSGLPGKMFSIGENIVKGIWNGLSAMGGWLWNQISGFASNILGDIGSAFGIHSPSKYTHLHGLMLGSGIATGIIASIPKAVAAARQMASRVLAATAGMRAGGFEAGSALAASAAGPAVTGSGGITIIIDVHGNTVLSDSDADRFAEKIGRRLATTLLPAAGRGIPL